MTFGSGYTKGSGFISAFLYDVHKELKQSRTLLKNFATLAGREWAFMQLYSNLTQGAATQGANYIAASQTASSLNDSLTTLPGEITTGGLARAQGTVTHIANTNVAIIYKDFTASADFTSPGITAAALFNAATVGTMAHVGTIDPILPVDNGETVRLTGTVNISIPV
jgi:hypothetical protein